MKTKSSKAKTSVKFKDIKSKSNPKAGYEGGGAGAGKMPWKSEFSGTGKYAP